MACVATGSWMIPVVRMRQGGDPSDAASRSRASSAPRLFELRGDPWACPFGSGCHKSDKAGACVALEVRSDRPSKRRLCQSRRRPILRRNTLWATFSAAAAPRSVAVFVALVLISRGNVQRGASFFQILGDDRIFASTKPATRKLRRRRTGVLSHSGRKRPGASTVVRPVEAGCIMTFRPVLPGHFMLRGENSGSRATGCPPGAVPQLPPPC